MGYLSLYRKWRPKSFAEVVGQEHVVRTLRNALVSGRIAHAYLFCGPRGTGKTSIARLLAKGLNCEHGPSAEPCQECDSCNRIDKGISLDVIEIDGASNRGIDEVRDLREKVKFAPTEGQYKVYIIDEVHMLTTDAFNALLKTLEEPPEHVVFVFATTEPHKIPATILSRCQRFDFKRFRDQQISKHLQGVAESEEVKATTQALVLIAKHAAGGMRDALGLLDQCLAFTQEDLTAEIVGQVLGVVDWDSILNFMGSIVRKETVQALQLVQQVNNQGRDLRQFVLDCISLCRDLLLIKAGAKDDASELTVANLEATVRLAEELEIECLLHYIDVFSKAENEVKWASQSKLPVEMAVIRAINGIPVGDSSVKPASLETSGSANEPQMSNLTAMIDSLRRELGGRLLQLDSEVSELRRELGNLKSRGITAETSSSLSSSETDAADSDGTQTPTESSSVNEIEQETLDVSEVGQRWEEVLESLRTQRKVTIAALLREGRPALFKSGELIIAFPDSNGFHKASLEHANNKSHVEQVLSSMFRRTINIACKFEEEIEGSVPAVPPKAEEKGQEESDEQNGSGALDHDPLVRSALQLFNGKIEDF